MVKTISPLKSWEHLRFWNHGWTEMDIPFEPVLPDRKNWFRALEETPFEEVRCVILGQDPYPTRGHADGLAFSVQPHVRPIPASLRNIFKEYSSDLGYPTPSTGDLSGWAERGVLLLNTILTVEEGKPLSHAGLGWERLSYEIIRSLVDRGNCVFVLWGQRANELSAAIDPAYVVSSAHPSQRSAERGFFGSKPFSRVNRLLEERGLKHIDWKLR